MPAHHRYVRTVALAGVAAGTLLLAAAPASADTEASGGGGATYAPPSVRALRCPAATDERACPLGSELRIRGENLEDVTAVVFAGRRGDEDDAPAAPTKTAAHRLIVTIPAAAHTGRLTVVSDVAKADGPRLRVAPAAQGTKGTAPEGVFPIRAKHRYGTAVNRFGGGRGHEGEDIFARCGAPLVAALSGTVSTATYHGRAGNYVVIDAVDGTSQAYMHLSEASPLAEGDLVAAGEPIGSVGETGRAEGCQLHFELWTAPGWYKGGTAVDPHATLKGWDRAS